MHFLVEDARGSSPLAFRAIHRDIRVSEELFRAFSLARAENNPDAGGAVDLVAREMKRGNELAVDAFGSATRKATSGGIAVRKTSK